MRRKSTFTLITAIVMIFAFALTAFAAAPAKKAVKKPAPKKPAVAAKKGATPATPAKPATPAVKPAAAAAGAAAVGAAAGSAATAPAAEPAAPGGLTGDKATAYNMLAKAKYSGKAKGNWTATIKGVPLLGDVNMKVTTTTAGKSTVMVTDGVPGMVGGDHKAGDNFTVAAVPFGEVVDSDEAKLVAFLKEANDVTITGKTIKVAKTNPPTSMVTLLDSVSKKVSWPKSSLDMTCTINLDDAGNVKSIDNVLITGKCKGSTGTYDGTVKCSFDY